MLVGSIMDVIRSWRFHFYIAACFLDQMATCFRTTVPDLTL